MRKLATAVAVMALAAPLPASAAGASVAVSPATADPEYATVLTLRGSGFQSISKAYGGVYVFFGWVADGAWRPSQGGSAGATYRYVQDSEAKDNNGFQRFVAFPGSDTESAANGGVVAADGTWSTQLVVPGARFRTADRDGNVVDVDCTKVRCGVITIGAHGVVNTTNETFTPVSFAVPRQAAPAAPPTSATPSSSTAAPTTSATPLPPPPPPPPPAQPPVAPVAAPEPESTPGWVPVAAASGGGVLLAAGAGTLLWLRRRRNLGGTDE
ncbi:hypothetical protein [Amycolatopsis suaedae]|uniref:LPXTG cell wall anchor domain-containing protein n=1 Tax=Amycolatopsis suaedae TaxID=2510978 RepID=A0A4V2EL07_9PSEU|nr:hypothetical protein [Amycolatopsis suaedae]RZQ59905.1 hypothetical protein EWH70_31230 [Amycolatopsis suaedae]